MTGKGHLLFSISCALAAHQLPLTTALAQAPLWQTIPASLACALLPDLDHPKSTLGQALPWLSVPLAKVFGHRGFTHSLFAVALAIWGLNLHLPPHILSVALKDAMIVGYLSHLLADWLTPSGIPLFWPIKKRFRLPLMPLKSGGVIELLFCITTLFAVALWEKGWHAITLSRYGRTVGINQPIKKAPNLSLGPKNVAMPPEDQSITPAITADNRLTNVEP